MPSKARARAMSSPMMRFLEGGRADGASGFVPVSVSVGVTGDWFGEVRLDVVGVVVCSVASTMSTG